MAQYGKVIRVPYVTRSRVQSDRNTFYVFGDNMAKKGLGGQAAAMRGEPNAIGVPTKWSPTREESAYFTDADFKNPDVVRSIITAFAAMKSALIQGHNVVIPTDGLGTGLAELPTRAPSIYRYIQSCICELEHY